jgi:hypothetical protein
MVFGGLDSTAVAPKSADGNLIYTTGGTCRIQMNLIGGRSRSKRLLSFWESPSEVHRRSAVQQCFYHQIIQI